MGRLWRVKEADLEAFIQASRVLRARKENEAPLQER
jgi:hypothetical protein